jgi:hypothetical protein
MKEIILSSLAINHTVQKFRPFSLLPILATLLSREKQRETERIKVTGALRSIVTALSSEQVLGIIEQRQGILWGS